MQIRQLQGAPEPAPVRALEPEVMEVEAEAPLEAALSADNVFLDDEEMGSPRDVFLARTNAMRPRPDPGVIQGLWDGFVSEVGNTYDSLMYLAQLSPDELRKLYQGVMAIYEEFRAGRAKELFVELGEAVAGDLLDALREFDKNPEYYGGYIAGNLLAGGAWGKLARILRLPNALRRFDGMGGKQRAGGANWDTSRSRPEPTPHVKRDRNGRRPSNHAYANKTFTFKDRRLRRKYPHGVPFNKQGRPDFARYKRADVPMKFSGDHRKDARSAEAYMDKRRPGWRNNLDPNQTYTWHHHQDVDNSGYGRLQLIPTDLHNAVRHYGGQHTRRENEARQRGGPRRGGW